MAGVKDLTIERDQDAELVSHVSAKDFNGKALQVKMSGTVNTKKCGVYDVVYSATDAIGNTQKATAKITIVDTRAPKISQVKDIVVDDQTSDIQAAVLKGIQAVDSGETLGTSAITLDTSALQSAMASQSYGQVVCSAYATDAAGNRSQTIRIDVTYQNTETEPPVEQNIEENIEE